MAEPAGHQSEPELPTVSIREFSSAVSAYRKRMNVAQIIGMVMFFAGPGAMFLFFGSPRDMRLDGINDTDIKMLGLLSIALPGPIAILVGIASCERWNRRDKRLACPGCGNRLASVSRHVIATGNCSFCGRRVLDGSGTLDEQGNPAQS